MKLTSFLDAKNSNQQLISLNPKTFVHPKPHSIDFIYLNIQHEMFIYRAQSELQQITIKYSKLNLTNLLTIAN